MLDKEFSESFWAVFAVDSKGDWSAASSGNDHVRNKGQEDQIVMNNILVANDTKSCECTLYIWKALKSQYRRLRTASSTEQEKLMNLKSFLEIKMNSTSADSKWGAQKWKDELVEELNNKSLPWKHLVVTKLGYSVVPFYFILFVQDFTIAICFT